MPSAMRSFRRWRLTFPNHYYQQLKTPSGNDKGKTVRTTNDISTRLLWSCRMWNRMGPRRTQAHHGKNKKKEKPRSTKTLVIPDVQPHLTGGSLRTMQVHLLPFSCKARTGLVLRVPAYITTPRLFGAQTIRSSFGFSFRIDLLWIDFLFSTRGPENADLSLPFLLSTLHSITFLLQCGLQPWSCARNGNPKKKRKITEKDHLDVHDETLRLITRLLLLS